MNDNLAQLIQNEQVGEQTSATDFESHENEVVNSQPVSQIEQSVIIESTEEKIDVIMLSEWIDENIDNLEKINKPKAQLQGVSMTDQLFCTVLDPNGRINEDEQPVRFMALINNANIFPVLDIPGYDMDVYGNGFQIMYSYNQDIVLKCYGIKTGLIIVFCLPINNQLIPYKRLKLKKRDTHIIVPHPNRQYISENILASLDIEGLQIQYKQVQKEMDQITDKQSAITWLLGKQTNIRDINHLLQIDDILIWLIS